MGRSKRHTCARSASSPEALAALLPNEIKSLEGLHTRSDYLSLRGHIVDWLSHAVPGQDQVLVSPDPWWAQPVYRPLTSTGKHSGLAKSRQVLHTTNARLNNVCING